MVSVLGKISCGITFFAGLGVVVTKMGEATERNIAARGVKKIAETRHKA